jgi:putative restriction endonuclease
MRQRIGRIRDRIGYKGPAAEEIGCVLIVQPVFFPRELWVRPPRDWPVRTQAEKKYDLTVGEGERVWDDCLRAAATLHPAEALRQEPQVADSWRSRYGTPMLVVPRLGQGTFRVAVTEAYARGCAVTNEHSLPALEAAHIKFYSPGGPHHIRNGLLLRADLHRLFDQGYITVTPELHLEVSRRLREDFANGRSYYPLHGNPVRVPRGTADRPLDEFILWHNENVYLG